ncbi:IS110 family transposase, partial [Bradyrhizobium canariense]|uniref:transposase n=1 Tax=Bradyrhizobium canariense TaxID=255045 RepID=UPI001C67B6EC
AIPGIRILGKDVSRIDGLGPYLALKLIAECGDEPLRLADRKTLYVLALLGLAPSNKISGGKVLSRAHAARGIESRRFCGLLRRPRNEPVQR